MVFKWANGFLSRGADATQVAKELSSLGKKLTPQQIVEQARKKNSAMHNIFEWDNSKAADEWRLHQARLLMCAIVTIKSDDGDGQPIRAFVSVSADQDDSEEGSKKQRHYVSMSAAMSKAEWREEVLADARRELEGWSKRYQTYSELSKEVKMVRRIASRIPEKVTA